MKFVGRRARARCVASRDVIPTGGTRTRWYLVGRWSFRGAWLSLRNGCNSECKGVVADNILKRARVCCGQSSLVGAARTMLKRARRRENRNQDDGCRQGVAREAGSEGEMGLYVKGGRAHCYLACSPDEISASSFRPSSPLLPRSSPPSLPSSYASFLFCFYIFPRTLLCPPDLPRRSCRAKTFSARAIVVLLIALGFPPFSLSLFPSLFPSFSFLLI